MDGQIPTDQRPAVLRRVTPTDSAGWAAYHAIRRAVLWEARGRSDYDTNHPDETEDGNHPMLFLVNGEPVGVVRIDLVPEKGEAIFRRVAIVIQKQRKGHGTRLMEEAERFARKLACESTGGTLQATASLSSGASELTRADGRDGSSSRIRRRNSWRRTSPSDRASKAGRPTSSSYKNSPRL